MARAANQTSSTTPSKPQIVIPESFERRYGITPEYPGFVKGIPEGTIYKWVRHPRYDAAHSFSRDSARGFRPMTWTDWEAGKYETPGAYVIKDENWVAMGDTILMTAPVQTRLKANFERSELDKALLQKEKTPSFDGEVVEVGETEGPLELQKGSLA